MQCYTSVTDWCEWKKNGYPLDNFDKLRSDEWQICSKQPGEDQRLIDPNTQKGKD